MDKIGIRNKGDKKVRPQLPQSVGRGIETFILTLAIVAIVMLSLVFLSIIKEVIASLPYLQRREMSFLSGWNQFSSLAQRGIVHLVVNSVMVSCGATLVALPLGLITALYITEIAGEGTARMFKNTMKGMAAIPPVVIGFLGTSVLAAKKPGLQISYSTLLMSGALLLAFMIYPDIVCLLVDTLRRIPESFRESSYALGATQWQTILHTVYPAAKPGIVAAGLFGFGRVLGDTVIVLLLAQSIPGNQLEPLLTMPAAIATGARWAMPGEADYYVVFVLGFLLMAISFALSHIGRRLMRTQRGELE